MGWQSIISLAVLGKQTTFLFIFIFISILFAAILIFVEFRIKNKKVMKEKLSEEDLFIQKVLRYKKLEKTPREKLDLLDSSAKNYFKEHFNC